MSSRLRCVYCDLDGTLLGFYGSMLHDGEGHLSLLGVRALEACDRAGVEFVLYSGRRKVEVMEDARLIGQRAFIYEIGCGLVIDGEEELLTGDLVPREDRTIHDQITDSGAPALLLEHYAGRFEYHAPWHLGREISHLFRGDVDAFEADRLLEEHGHGRLRLVDNGALPRGGRVYHLLPRPASKTRALERHMRARGYGPDECIAIGDSREDMGAAAAVDTFWLVANAVARDPSIREALAPNVRVTEAAHGAGVYEAVITTLAERRA
jgi:hydroxymethylpyrimidine pyrophosphatase-like HAD family hydrolase